MPIPVDTKESTYKAMRERVKVRSILLVIRRLTTVCWSLLIIGIFWILLIDRQLMRIIIMEDDWFAGLSFSLDLHHVIFRGRHDT